MLVLTPTLKAKLISEHFFENIQSLDGISDLFGLVQKSSHPVSSCIVVTLESSAKFTHSSRKLLNSFPSRLCSDQTRARRMFRRSLRLPKAFSTSLCRFRFKLKSKVVNLKKRLIRNMHLIFPGYDRLFSSIFTKTSIAILNKAPRPSNMLEMGEKSYMN